MTRSSIALATLPILGALGMLYARSHNADYLLDRVEGVRISSRLPCDGSTNPQEELKMQTTFSPGGWQKSFHLDIFESRYCKRLDLYFFCVMHGHDRWKHEWVANSQGGPAPRMYWLNACSSWGTKDNQDYILSGWYQEGEPSNKLPWKQAAIRQVSAAPEIYEFSDPQGGTARLEIKRN